MGAIGLLKLSPAPAILDTPVAIVLRWLSVVIHQLGHMLAARLARYPMRGTVLWLLPSPSISPKEEPALPADIHIRRMLGGPITSLALAPLAGLCALGPHGPGGILWWIALFFFPENLLALMLGAIWPPGCTEARPLLSWVQRR